MIFHENDDGLAWYEFELFMPYKHKIKHACFTRKGGVSNGPYRSLNLGLSVGDNEEQVVENRRRVASFFDATLKQLFDLEQVHSTHSVEVFNAPFSSKPQGDILLTQAKNAVLLIKQADCQAAILYDPLHHVVSCVHAGWRGQVKRAYTTAIHEMEKKWKSRPKDILVGISPSLGFDKSEFLSWEEDFPKCFHAFVYPNNLKNRTFSKTTLDYETHRSTPEHVQDKDHADLKAMARYELLEAGIVEEHIEISPLCTYEYEDLFFSYRRDKTTGRQGTAVQLLD